MEAYANEGNPDYPVNYDGNNLSRYKIKSGRKKLYKSVGTIISYTHPFFSDKIIIPCVRVRCGFISPEQQGRFPVTEVYSHQDRLMSGMRITGIRSYI